VKTAQQMIFELICSGVEIKIVRGYLRAEFLATARFHNEVVQVSVEFDYNVNKEKQFLELIFGLYNHPDVQKWGITA
jgi:hypothetical protein